jgi:hypothetical protein
MRIVWAGVLLGLLAGCGVPEIESVVPGRAHRGERVLLTLTQATDLSDLSVAGVPRKVWALDATKYYFTVPTNAPSGKVAVSVVINGRSEETSLVVMDYEPARVFHSVSLRFYSGCVLDQFDHAWCWDTNAAEPVPTPVAALMQQAWPRFETSAYYYWALATTGAVEQFHDDGSTTANFCCYLDFVVSETAHYEDVARFIDTDRMIFQRDYGRLEGYPPGTTFAAAEEFQCMIDDEREIDCGGSNHRGQLGNGTTKPTETAIPIRQRGPWRDVAVMEHVSASSCGVKADGELWCWGLLDFSRSGDELAHQVWNETISSLPLRVDKVQNSDSFVEPPAFERVKARAGTFCASSSNTLYCWGNFSGDFFPMNDTIRRYPVRLTSANGSRIVDFSMYSNAVCAVNEAGELWCWDAGWWERPSTPKQIVVR